MREGNLNKNRTASGPIRFCLVVFLLLLLSSLLDLWIHPFRPFVGFIKLETMNLKQIEKLDKTRPFWNAPLSVLALAATVTNPWTMWHCPITVASSYKSDCSFQPLTTNKYLLSCNVFFLLLSKHLLGPRITIECRKQVNHSRTKSLCFIRPFLILARILPCSFTS